LTEEVDLLASLVGKLKKLKKLPLALLAEKLKTNVLQIASTSRLLTIPRMITVLETTVFNSFNSFNFFRSAEGRFFEQSESEELPPKNNSFNTPKNTPHPPNA
jgi:hypothetical protein